MKSIKEQVEYLRDFVVDEKNALFDRLIQERTDYVTVVLEDLFQSHNQSAVMRSADCYGIQHVHLIENRNSYDMTSTVSQGARDWLSIHRHKELENNTQATIDQLRAEGYRILATTPHANDIFVDDIDLEKGKMAFFFAGAVSTGIYPIGRRMKSYSNGIKMPSKLPARFWKDSMENRNRKYRRDGGYELLQEWLKLQ